MDELLFTTVPEEYGPDERTACKLPWVDVSSRRCSVLATSALRICPRQDAVDGLKALQGTLVRLYA